MKLLDYMVALWSLARDSVANAIDENNKSNTQLPFWSVCSTCGYDHERACPADAAQIAAAHSAADEDCDDDDDEEPLPLDYEMCGTCGYDHVYDGATHSAEIAAEHNGGVLRLTADVVVGE